MRSPVQHKGDVAAEDEDVALEPRESMVVPKGTEDATLVASSARLADVVARATPAAGPIRRSSQLELIAAMRELYAEGDTETALAVANVLAADLEDRAENAGPSSEEEGTRTRIGSIDSDWLQALTSRRVPRVLVGPKELAKLPVDPRAAFILAQIDGTQTMQEILDVCPMPEAEALALLEWLCALGAIALD